MNDVNLYHLLETWIVELSKNKDMDEIKSVIKIHINLKVINEPYLLPSYKRRRGRIARNIHGCT